MSNRKISKKAKVASTSGTKLASIVGKIGKEAMERLTSGTWLPGRCTVLAKERNVFVVQRLLLAAKQGIKVGCEVLTFRIGRIAADGRNGDARGETSSEVLSTFRARHWEIKLHSKEKKEPPNSCRESRAYPTIPRYLCWARKQAFGHAGKPTLNLELRQDVSQHHSRIKRVHFQLFNSKARCVLKMRH